MVNITAVIRKAGGIAVKVNAAAGFEGAAVDFEGKTVGDGHKTVVGGCAAGTVGGVKGAAVDKGIGIGAEYYRRVGGSHTVVAGKAAARNCKVAYAVVNDLRVNVVVNAFGIKGGRVLYYKRTLVKEYRRGVVGLAELNVKRAVTGKVNGGAAVDSEQIGVGVEDAGVCVNLLDGKRVGAVKFYVFIGVNFKGAIALDVVFLVGGFVLSDGQGVADAVKL